MRGFTPQERDLWEAALQDDASSPLARPEELEDTRSLWELLKKVDPAMALRWHYKDARKVLRSIRVLQTTGKRQSEWIAEQDARDQHADETSSPWRVLIFWVWRDPAKLNASLESRIHKMVDRGLLDEIKQLREIAGRNADYTRGIFQAIGYKEFDPYMSYIESPGATKDEAQARRLFEQGVEGMKVATRQYAKKQVSWIRNKLVPEIRKRQESDRTHDRPVSVEIFLLDVTEEFGSAVVVGTSILKSESSVQRAVNN